MLLIKSKIEDTTGIGIIDFARMPAISRGERWVINPYRVLAFGNTFA